MIRVIVVDDQRLIRAGLRMLCESTGDIEVVGEGGSGVDAIRLAAELSPDVILMDLRMPGLDGIEATRRITGHSPAPKVLVLTTFDDDEHLFPALAAGADGFLVKDTAPADLVDAVRRVAAGDLPFSPDVLRRLVARAAETGTTPPPEQLSAATELTPRETDVLGLVGEGLGNQEIADRLHLGVSTVKSHVANLMDKTGCDNRVRLAVYAVRRGGQ
ncbi:response regulator transcription factor [Prescottella sp. R16]|uniref:response regulator transcription factor n=1 Tax=Prescottella sp. R16 TaxID=3064529 RepID=UPI00272EC098|nr:response regulator transcription factor [Prescottella sp. R16]